MQAMYRLVYRLFRRGLTVLSTVVFGLILTVGCGSSGTDDNDLGTPPNPPNGEDKEDEENEEDNERDDEVTEAIRLNQLGFLPSGRKWAVVPQIDADSFSIVTAGTDNEVHTGELGAAATWEPADESVRLADFSTLVTPGEYQLRVEGLGDSHVFTIGAEVYGELNAAALKAYYFNRASIELEEAHAGEYARPLGHPDNAVLIHQSAEDGSRSAGDLISAPKGWYDAGDFGKYVVNSGISTYTLLAAYEHFPDYYAAQDLNIPESGNEWPDILDEALWNLAWMLDMQDEDGGVYHKLTTRSFAGAVMPHEATAERYAIGKATAATLNFAATMAVASRVYEPFDTSLSEQMRSAAEDAWNWAEANPGIVFSNPADVSTGEYGDGAPFDDEFAWAAAELYITTQDPVYYQAFEAQDIGLWVPAWPDTRGLAWMSLAFHKDSLGEAADLEAIESEVVGLAQTLTDQHQNSAYRVAMSSGDFYWGSNGNVLNRAMMLLQGYRLNGNEDFREAAQSLLDYILGRNPTGYSYVTGYGDKTPMDIHHRASYADDIEAPVPGFVAGGPNPNNQGDCGESVYPSQVPAKAYVDDWCSYSTNEVTINWNAPLVYVSGALQAWALEGEE